VVKLQQLGMTSSEEAKLLAMRDYILKLASAISRFAPIQLSVKLWLTVCQFFSAFGAIARGRQKSQDCPRHRTSEARRGPTNCIPQDRGRRTHRSKFSDDFAALDI
jgi:hypothetical protein